MKVIVAGGYNEAAAWCRDNNLNPRSVVMLFRAGDENKVRGLLLTDDDVEYVGSWNSLPQEVLVAFEAQIRFCTR